MIMMKNKLLEKTFALLEAVSCREEPVSLRELSATLHCPASTLSRIAADLVAAGVLTKSSYHTYAPGLGLIRHGQNALNHTRLTRVANPLIRARAEALKVNGALAGIDAGQLVYLFRCDAFAAPERSGFACRVPLWRSNLAIAILAGSRSRGEAWRELYDSWRTEPGGSALPDDLSASLDEAAATGRLFRHEANGHWNISQAFAFEQRWYALALYGAGQHGFSETRLLLEVSRLTEEVCGELG